MFDAVFGGMTAGFLGDVAGALYGNYASAKAATKQFDREKWMASNRYQLMVGDLKKAGLNPMLAVGATPPSASPSLPQMRGPEFGRTGQATSAAQAARAQAAVAEAQVDVAHAQAGKLRAETVTEMNRPANVEAMTGREVASAGQIQQETANLRLVADKLMAEMRQIAADIRLKGAQSDTLDALREVEVRVKALEARGQELRLPESEARGRAGDVLSKGQKFLGDVADTTGHFIGGKIADVADYYRDLSRKAAEARRKRLEDLKKNPPRWKGRYGG